jgi:hypothetical protein
MSAIRRRTRSALLLPVFLLFGLLAASPASASHLRGGTLSADISATGQMTINASWIQREGFCDGVGPTSLSVDVTSPSSATIGKSVDLPLARCNGGAAEWRGSATFDLSDATDGFGSFDPGVYQLHVSNCCRVAGIMNSANSNYIDLTASVRAVPGTATGSPQFLGTTATGAAIGYDYLGDVTAQDPEGSDVSYTLMQKADNTLATFDAFAPDTNVVELAGPIAKAPAALTGTWSVGDKFVYKVHAVDAGQDLSTLDILVEATDNKPPTLSAPDTVTVVSGQHGEIPLSATDPDAGDTVTINHTSGPDWATMTATAGNPATGSVTLDPPAGVTGHFYVSQYAVDDNPTVALLDSRTVNVLVVPPAPSFATTPEVSSTQQSPSFSFSGTEGTTFECSLDDGEWAACTSPYHPTGLAVGSHTLSIRSVDASTGAQSASRTYDWAIVAPAAPAAAAPAAAPITLTSTRKVLMHWRVAARYGALKSQVLVIDGKRTRIGRSVRATTVDMTGALRKTVRVQVIAMTRSGKRIGMTRVYRTCRDVPSPAGQPQLALRPLTK